jgi:putative endonuclease
VPARPGQANAARRRSFSGVPEAYVYILRCGDGSLYTGWTSDVARRLAEHSAGKASRYTRSRLPVELAASFSAADASAARRREAQIKRLSRTQKLALLERP